MKLLSELKKEFRKDQDLLIDFEKGETFKDWWEGFVDALREDGSLVKVGGKMYVKD